MYLKDDSKAFGAKDQTRRIRYERWAKKDTDSERRSTERRITERRITEHRIIKHRITERSITKR